MANYCRFSSLISEYLMSRSKVLYIFCLFYYQFYIINIILLISRLSIFSTHENNLLKSIFDINKKYALYHWLPHFKNLISSRSTLLINDYHISKITVKLLFLEVLCFFITKVDHLGEFVLLLLKRYNIFYVIRFFSIIFWSFWNSEQYGKQVVQIKQESNTL